MNPLHLSDALDCLRDVARLEAQLREIQAHRRSLEVAHEMLYGRQWADWSSFRTEERNVCTKLIGAFEDESACMLELKSARAKLAALSPTELPTIEDAPPLAPPSPPPPLALVPQQTAQLPRRGSRTRRAVSRFRAH